MCEIPISLVSKPSPSFAKWQMQSQVCYIACDSSDLFWIFKTIKQLPSDVLADVIL